MACQKELMAEGKAYPRTCEVCGEFGSCGKGYNPKWTPDNPVGYGPTSIKDLKPVTRQEPDDPIPGREKVLGGEDVVMPTVLVVEKQKTGGEVIAAAYQSYEDWEKWMEEEATQHESWAGTWENLELDERTSLYYLFQIWAFKQSGQSGVSSGPTSESTRSKPNPPAADKPPQNDSKADPAQSPAEGFLDAKSGLLDRLDGLILACTSGRSPRELEWNLASLQKAVQELSNPLPRSEGGSSLDQAWIQTAIESNKAVDAYLRSVYPELPEHYGMPADGVRLTIEHLKGSVDLQVPTSESYRMYDLLSPEEKAEVLEFWSRARKSREDGNLEEAKLNIHNYAFRKSGDNYECHYTGPRKAANPVQLQAAVLKTSVPPDLTERQFKDQVMIEVLPLAIQLHSYPKKSPLTGVVESLATDYGAASLFAVTYAEALWKAREKTKDVELLKEAKEAKADKVVKPN